MGCQLRKLLSWAGSIALAAGSVACGKPHDAGEVQGKTVPARIIEERANAQASTASQLAGGPAKQILFGDLHVHSTFSADAYAMSLPVMQGEGAHPVSDACDFARYCSALDFWSINDHSENLTPRMWRQTKQAIRQCNARSGEPGNPDLVSFLGWEWSQIGLTPKTHYGHKNVIFLDTEEDQVPRRPIHAGGLAEEGPRRSQPFGQRIVVPLFDWPNRQYYWDGIAFQAEIQAVRACPAGVDTRQLPDDCHEAAATPQVLFEKLSQWGFESMVIPHGTTWGLYSPPGSSWDKQLSAKQHDPDRQRLVEVFSGHGNSEEYRPWRAVHFDKNGERFCPEPQGGFEPCCWRAGEIVRGHCEDPDAEDCKARVVAARQNVIDAGRAYRNTLPAASVEDWRDCDSCPDCFRPSMNYRSGNSVQYMLALSNLDQPEGPQRFQFGFISSSDNHRARPGTGYKEYRRLSNTEAFGPRSETWNDLLYRDRRGTDPRESIPWTGSAQTVLALLVMDFERQASFFLTGGLVAAHSEGRSREQIWAALGRRETYGTSGPRILLWFDLLNSPEGPIPMGQAATLSQAPRFRVRAAGSLAQKPGCPAWTGGGLPAERLERLCRGECYNPTDERHLITRIEVIRIRPQVSEDEAVETLIEDPWQVLPCSPDPAGCIVEFEDEDFASSGRPAVYYVRAIQEPSPAINGDGLRCQARDEFGICTEVEPCYGDYRTAYDDDCTVLQEERAWSSPLYLEPAS